MRALANHLARLEGDSVQLLATAEAGQLVALDATDTAEVKIFPRVAPRWLSRSPELRQHLAATDHDCVHNHALWLLPLHYAHESARRQGVPLIISPRGMMSGWAYRHRRWRKWISEIVVHPGAFHAAAGWHATSEDEANDIRALGFTQPICVSPNGVAIPETAALSAARSFWHEQCPATKNRPVALFYSRLHRKKRVRELIDLWRAEPRGDWLLLIVGVAEDYTVTELQSLVGADATDIAVFDGQDRPAPYAVASLFVLPSHSENFGLVIVEALAAGVPALVTDTTPWQGLHTHDCGWCVAWADFGRHLSRALAEPRSTLAAQGARGRVWAENEFSWDRAARLLRQFYGELRHA